jgi:alpha/beta superfamily hydrolase
MDIPGPAGALEAEFTLAPDDTGEFAALCHPHPQYGGNMHDGVLATVESALLQSGISCLRFNFRGVGRSEGQSTASREEVDDLLAVIAWLRAEQSPDRVCLAGYSFGASIAWQAISASTPDRVLLIAPPVGLMPFEPVSQSGAIDIFTGDRDDYVDVHRLEQLEGATVHVLPGADHFFLGQQPTLQNRIVEAIS